MVKRLMVGLAIGTLMVALVPGLTTATIADGRPGQYEMSAMYINGFLTSRDDGECVGVYVDVVAGNSYISNPFGEPGTVHVVVNKQGASATCKFTDTSGVYEANAEVGWTESCTLWTDDGIWSGGDGRITAAANNAKDDSNGGNVTMHCTFDADDFVAYP